MHLQHQSVGFIRLAYSEERGHDLVGQQVGAGNSRRAFLFHGKTIRQRRNMRNAFLLFGEDLSAAIPRQNRPLGTKFAKVPERPKTLFSRQFAQKHPLQDRL
jgi:hypothetical protein